MSEHFIPLSSIHRTGVISSCGDLACECHHHCCTQQKPLAGDSADPLDSILLYPGEWDQQTEKHRQHILITGKQSGGKFGYCDPQRIDQSQCHPLKNFKPLDCKSYPFFPSFIEGVLVLLKDPRCPMTPENEPNFDHHYQAVLKTWRRLIAERPEVATWILSLSLPGYEVYTPPAR